MNPSKEKRSTERESASIPGGEALGGLSDGEGEESRDERIVLENGRIARRKRGRRPR